jgi:uncharacterized repeat protein (TIGR03803 family)
VAQGQSATFTLTVQSQNGFHALVTPAALNLPTGYMTSGTGWNPPTVTPAANGSASSTLTVATNAGTTPGTYNVTLQATSAGYTARTVPVTITVNKAVGTPAISVTPASLAFGSVPVGSSVSQNFTVKNSGTGTLIGTATVAAPFSITSGATYSLAAGASQIVTLKFSPTAVQSSSQTVTFTGGAGATATATGTGTQAANAILMASPTCNGSSPEIYLSLALSGGTESTFDLWRNGASISVGNTGMTLADYGSAILAGQSYSYYVVVHLSTGISVTSNTVQATAPSSCAISPISVAVPEGGAQSFSTTLSGGATWSINEGSSGGTLADSLAFSTIYVPPASLGTFHVVATSLANSTQTVSATISVRGPVSTSTVLSLPPSPGGTAFPSPIIQGSDSLFYGMTQWGGNLLTTTEYLYCPAAPGCGVIFKVDSTGNMTILHAFSGSDGGNPVAGLVQGKDKFFYGTTPWGGGSLNCSYNGGAASCGTLFKIDSSGNFTSLYSFTGTKGAFPVASLIQASDGYFYGVASQGGTNCLQSPTAGCGTVFKYDPTSPVGSGNPAVIWSFTGGTDGAIPRTALVQGKDGYLYGATSQGGTANGGVIFQINLAAGKLTPLHQIAGNEGGNLGPLIQATDGNFYGACAGCIGVLFKMDSVGNFTLLHTFVGTPEGQVPFGPLVEGADGYFYGVFSAALRRSETVTLRDPVMPVLDGLPR